MHIYIDKTVLFELLARLRNKSKTDRFGIMAPICRSVCGVVAKIALTG